MVFNDVGQEAHARRLPLGAKAGIPVLGGGGLLCPGPALRVLAQAGGRKVEHGGEVPLRPDEFRQTGGVGVEHLAHRKGLVGSEGLPFHLLQKLAQTLCHAGLRKHPAAVGKAVRPVRRVVPEGQVLFDVHNGVDAETRHALVQPPVDHVVDLPAQRRILPVQVRLLFVKEMQVVKIALAGYQAPGAAPKVTPPVAGRLAVFALAEVEILPVGSLRVLHCLFEPDVLIRAVVHHQVHHQADVPLSGFLQQAVHVLHGTEAGIDGLIIRDIIALVRQRALVHRR